MLGYDLLFQHNRPSLSKVPEHICTGFMAIPNNPYSRAFARHARRWLEICDHPEIGDQNACIEVLRRSPDCLTFGFPPVSYWSPGSSLGRWLPGRRLKPPRQMILHHANHTVGIGHKIQQLRTVEAMFTALPQTAGAVAVQRP